MGVKLSGLLPTEEIAFEDLAKKKVAVDFSNSVYQFLSSIRSRDGAPLMDSKGRITSHLMGIWSRFSNLMQKGVKLAIVFDGQPPALKTREKEKRAEKKEEAEEKLREAIKKKDVEAMFKYAKRTARLSGPMVDESKELIAAMGLPIIQAPSEADAQMAFMCEKGDVDYVVTSDVDPLLHGAQRLITNLTLSQRRRLPSGGYVITKPYVIKLSRVLNELGITQDQLIAMSILVGTDYNEGVHGIGPKTALRLVKQYKKSTFNQLFKEVKAKFNWKQIYAIYKSMPIMKNYQLKWGEPDPYKIKKMLVDKHEFSEERVDSTLKKITKGYRHSAASQKGLGEFF